MISDFDLDRAMQEYYGFVYLTTLPDGRMYIGKKAFWSKRRLKPLKGQKRKRIVMQESDWRTYYGSSEIVKDYIKKHGTEGVTRTMLALCKDKWSLSYAELQFQLQNNVLFTEKYLNNIIHIRLKGRPNYDLRSMIKVLR